MKNLLIKVLASIAILTISLPTSPRGGGFGSCFGGSLLGSFAGSTISNAMTQPRQTTTVVQERPVYIERQQAPSVQYVEVRKPSRSQKSAKKAKHRVSDDDEDKLLEKENTLLKAQLEAARAKEREAEARAEASEKKAQILELQIENNMLKKSAKSQDA